MQTVSTERSKKSTKVGRKKKRQMYKEYAKEGIERLKSTAKKKQKKKK